jgi:hypothetical protein
VDLRHPEAAVDAQERTRVRLTELIGGERPRPETELAQERALASALRTTGEEESTHRPERTLEPTKRGDLDVRADRGESAERGLDVPDRGSLGSHGRSALRVVGPKASTFERTEALAGVAGR